MKRNLIITLLFLLGLSTSISTYSQKNEIKLISYNVYWGMRSDSTENKSKFAKWLKEQDADIVALQEMNEFTTQDVEKFAASYGHPHAFIVKEPAPDGTETFPVAITSKYPIVNVRKVVGNTLHGFIEAEIGGHHFIVTHFHPFSAEKRGHEIDQILETMKSKPADWKWLLMGDLNSPSPLDKSEYDNNLLRNFIREDRKKRPHNENLKNDELDYTVQQKILDCGFVDAFKLFYPQFIASAPTKLFYDQSKHPLRYDYVCVSSNMKNDIIKCEIIKDAFTDVYSDHYPVILIYKK